MKTDSPYKSVKELFAHIKANPNKVVASGSGQGGSWHLALAGLMQADGIAPNSIRWVPATGAATALTDLAAGGVEFVSCSMPEAEALIKAGRIRSLTYMSATRAANFPDVPTVEEATGHKWHKGVWRGMAGPKGMPKEIAAQYETVIKKIWDSKEFQDFMKQRGFDLVWMDSAKFAAFMKTDNEDVGQDAEDARVGEVAKGKWRIAHGEQRVVNAGMPVFAMRLFLPSLIRYSTTR